MKTAFLVVIATAACTAATVHQATLSPAAQAKAASSHPPYTEADVHFVAGMIGHHAQAIQMAGWAPSHGGSAAVRTLCERIVVAQNDEIAFAQRWLREHNEFVPPADPRGHVMPGMDHPMLMPGMLTPDQLAQLDAARGPAKIDTPPTEASTASRLGLRAGWVHAAPAACYIRRPARTPSVPYFINRSAAGDLQFMISDRSFSGPYV